MELLEALKVIRDECKKHSRCKMCPLRSYDDKLCTITANINPDNWKFADEDTDEVPRLFK